jgi:hypothetical protein
MNKEDSKSNLNAINDFEKSGFSLDEFRAEDQQLLANDTSCEVNRFPVEVFPLAVQAIITATNEHLKYPIDFIAASILYAASVAMGNTYKVQVTNGWVESSVLWLAVVGRVGTNKTPPLYFALKPIIDEDEKRHMIYIRKNKEYEIASSLSKSERKEQSIDDPIKPVREKYLLSDFTPEALAQIHKYNLRGIGVYVDELAGWFKNFNRYNKGSDMEFWLSTWSGKPINIDRKTVEPILISLPYIPVAGTIQNAVLKELAKVSRYSNGLLDRILFVVPENLQKPYWNETEIEDKFIDQWRDIIMNILSITIDLDEFLLPRPVILHFTPKAKAILIQWQRSNADECNTAESEAVRGVINKLEIYAIRFALILQLLRWACNEGDRNAIGEEAVEGALQLVEYFKKSAIKVHSIIDNYSPLDDLTDIWRKLYEVLPSTFTKAEALEFADFYDISPDTFNKWLKKQTKILFKKLKQGIYEKLI